MKITIASTSKLVELDGVQCRIWEGETEHGARVHCFIPRIGTDSQDPKQLEQFAKDLVEQRAPSPAIASFPLRLIL
jgi:hypothetical protein